jgi:hypothetical protein
LGFATLKVKDSEAPYQCETAANTQGKAMASTSEYYHCSWLYAARLMSHHPNSTLFQK